MCRTRRPAVDAEPKLTGPAEPTRRRQKEIHAPSSAADAAVEHLDEWVRRHKRRSKKRHNDAQTAMIRGTSAQDYTVDLDAGGGYDGWDCSTAPDKSKAEHPLIVSESCLGIRALPVNTAVRQRDLMEKPFMLLRNASHGGLNVVYRRLEGSIGWTDTGASVSDEYTGTKGE